MTEPSIKGIGKVKRRGRGELKQKIAGQSLGTTDKLKTAEGCCPKARASFIQTLNNNKMSYKGRVEYVFRRPFVEVFDSMIDSKDDQLTATCPFLGRWAPKLVIERSLAYTRCTWRVFFENERGGRRRRRERDEIRMNFERAKEVLRHAVTLPGSPARK